MNKLLFVFLLLICLLLQGSQLITQKDRGPSLHRSLKGSWWWGHSIATRCKHNSIFRLHVPTQRSTKEGGREECDVRREIADGCQEHLQQVWNRGTPSSLFVPVKERRMWSSSAAFSSAELNYTVVQKLKAGTLDPQTTHPNLFISGVTKKKIYDICKEKVKSSSKSRETYGLSNSPGFWRIRFWRALPGSLGGWEAWMHHAGCRESPFPRWGSDPHQDRTDAGQPSFRMGTMSCEVLFQSLFFWRKAQRNWYLPGLQVAWDDILPFKWQVPHPFFHW